MIKTMYTPTPPLKVRTYPWLGRATDGDTLIVLFRGDRIGTVVREGKGWPVGKYCDCWAMDTFEAMPGVITLWND